ncbi:hypothetical protein BKA65DRAFT_527721 [Rhexocercosporidium sp. MPI-PUGE-AT-0058]|nr:hypothetical protein BKA65DRAFT_527721 [Rhexocercosporidium sp. MPI-PUGE-AT-0058]
MSNTTKLNTRPGSALPSEPYKGWPLSSSGPYHDSVERVSALIPAAVTTDYRNKWIIFANRHVAVTILDVKEETVPDCSTFAYIDTVNEHFEQRLLEECTPSSPPKRRIYILEGLNTEYIALFGGFFHMEPSFFIDQERTQIWDRWHYGTRMTEPLPSTADTTSRFHLPYFEMMYFQGPIRDFETSCTATGRQVGITRLNGTYEQEVIVRRKCSLWSRTNHNDGWDVIILTDPPVREVTHTRGLQVSHMCNTPFQGGYLDFIPLAFPLPDMRTGPPRTSMHDDLIYYWKTHYSAFESLSSPRVAALFPQKITASHYMQLLYWSDIQALNKRCAKYCEDVERIILTLDLDNAKETMKEDWMNTGKDFTFILTRLKVLKSRCEVLLGSITALVGIAGNRQSLEETKRSIREAKNVKLLTLIGMIFIPLAFVCGLFSMNDRYLPAVPVVIVMFLGAMMLSLGYDDDVGTWSVSNIWQTVERRN